MAITVYVVDDAKCLHDLLDVLGDQNVVAPTNHASTTNEYGAATYSAYGHVKLTNVGTVPSEWSDVSWYDAVSGSDGKILNDRIAQNASDIADMQPYVKVPIGTVIMSDALSVEALAVKGYNYGTWILLKNDSVVVDGTTYYFNYFYRTA